MKKVKIKDVAEKAGVSPSTVSQFINKRYHHMSASTKNRIEKVIEELNYQPNGIARSLKTKKTNTIGIVVANIVYTFSTYLSRGVEDFCQKNGYNVIICNADNNPEKERNYFQMLRNKQTDGVIIAATGKNIEYLQEEIQSGFPIVQIDRYFPELKTDIVQADNIKGSYEAVEHLIKNNYREIAIVVPDGELLSVRRDRLEGYYRALKAYNIRIEKDLVKFISKSNSRERLEELFRREQIPSAIFATNDIVVIEVLTFLKNKGLKVPRDMAVISFDDIPMAHLLETPLTVVAQPAYEIGKVAAEILINRIERNEKKYIPTIKTLKCKLISRGSCGKA